MKKNLLGRTGIEVTEICFGALPMGPLQKRLPLEECTALVKHALECGINFIDTAQNYSTYEPIGLALKETGLTPVIATKSTAEDYKTMQAAVDEALNAMQLDTIDIFLLHAARQGTEVFAQRSQAWQCLLDNKAKGRIKAVGISTHSAAVARMAASIPEVDIVFPLINSKGKGVLDGNTEDMLESIKLCALNHKGVYLMKVLAGGTLVSEFHDAMKFARSIEGYSSIALGMVSEQEIKFNIDYFNSSNPDALDFPTLKNFKKQFIAVESLCKGCKRCITACPNNVITLMQNGRASIQQDKCLQCGYCVRECPAFAIRLV